MKGAERKRKWKARKRWQKEKIARREQRKIDAVTAKLSDVYQGTDFGKVSNIKIYNRALTEEEVNQEFTAQRII
jgi:hypothetical protein